MRFWKLPAKKRIEGGEGGVDPEHEGEGADEGQGDLQQGLGEEVGGGADHAEVGGDAAEDLAGLGAVEEGEGEALEVVEEVGAQGGLDAEAEPLSADGAAPFEGGRADGEEGEEEGAPARRAEVARGEADLEDVEGDGGDEEAGARAGHDGGQVQRQQAPLRAIVAAHRPKPFPNRSHSLSFLA